MEISNKTIAWSIAGAFVLFLILSVISASNTAIGYEQNIEQSLSGIEVQQQRQYTLILQLVQVVEQASQFESDTQTRIAELRTAASTGNVEQAQVLIQAVAEAYPTLQANQTYVNLMNEMSISENLVAKYRDTYNSDVRNYLRFVKRFPTRLFLDVMGYDVQDYQYLQFENNDLPADLFKN